MNTKIRNEIKGLNKEINKQTDNKNALNKCETFCKTDYLPYVNKKIKKMFKNYGLKTLKKRSAQYEKDKALFKYLNCKKTFCNPGCIGYTFMGNKQKQEQFKKTLKNGFIPKYNKMRVKTLKKRGALSGCMHIEEYNR